MILRTLFSFYFFCLRGLLKLLFKNQITDIWPRNSFVFKDLTWRSDLDLTLIFKTEISGTDVALRLKSWSRRAHGEWNIYSPASAALISQVINPYELQRDPRLKNWLMEQNLKLPIPHPVDAAVFLMKQLSIDWKNLQLRPSARRKKWSRHFQQVGKSLDLNKDFISQIQMTITEFLALTPEQAQVLWKGHSELMTESLQPFRPEQPEFWQRNPWLWSFEVARFPFQSPLSPWTETQKQILLSEIRWEIFAALTQNWQTDGFDKHLSHLSQFLSANLSSTDLQESIQSARRCLKHH